MPPSGVKLSCMEFTLPVVKLVVTPANSPLWTTPKRTSLPSMLPPGWLELAAVSMPAFASSGVPACSDTMTTGRNRISSAPMTP